jgi:hypothetical protein
MAAAQAYSLQTADETPQNTNGPAMNGEPVRETLADWLSSVSLDGVWSKTALVDLRGQLSNHAARESVDLVETLLSRSEPCGEACSPALRGQRRVPISAKVDIGDMARRFANGAMIKELAATYSISGSSVKRLLRAQGVRKRNC